MEMIISLSSNRTTLYRGEGKGSDASVIMWLTPDLHLAKEYAAGRDSDLIATVEMDLKLQKVCSLSHDTFSVTPSSFFSHAYTQLSDAEFDRLDTRVVLAESKKFEKHFGNQRREVMDYWTNERDKKAVRDLLKSLGFTVIKVREGRNKTDTYGLLK